MKVEEAGPLQVVAEDVVGEKEASRRASGEIRGRV